MRKSVVIAGPWKGIVPATVPSQVQQGFLHDTRGFRFTDGKIHLGPGLNAVRPLPRTRPIRSDISTVFAEEDVFVSGAHAGTRAVNGSLVLDCNYVGTKRFTENFDNEPNGVKHIFYNNTTGYVFLDHGQLGTDYPPHQEIDATMDIKFVGPGGSTTEAPGAAGFYVRGDNANNSLGIMVEGVLGGGTNRRLELCLVVKTSGGIDSGTRYVHFHYSQGKVFTETFRVRLSIVGNTMRGKIWTLPDAEPSDWQITKTFTPPPDFSGRKIGFIHRTLVGEHGAYYDNWVIDITGMLPCTSGTWESVNYPMEAVVLLPRIKALLDTSTPVGTSVSIWFSTDEKTTWKQVQDGEVIPNTAQFVGAKIAFKAALTTQNSTVTPAVHNIKAEYGLNYVDRVVSEFYYPLSAHYIQTRSGNDYMLFVTRNGIYVGDFMKVYDVTPKFPPEYASLGFDKWMADEKSVITVDVLTTDATEWIILTSSDYPFLFRMDPYGDSFSVFSPPRGEGYLDVTGGRSMTVFNDRLVFGSVYTSLTEVSHAIAHYGIWGPFDNSFPTSGMIPLTDIRGPVTGFGKTHDFLVIFKANGIFVGQRTADPEHPIAIRPRVSTVGCSNAATIAELPGHRAVCFLGSDREFYIYDVNQMTRVSAPVQSYFQQRDTKHAKSFLSTTRGELAILFHDVILIWNYLDNWWAIDQNNAGLLGIANQRVIKMAMSIDENATIIDDAIGYIDEMPGAVIDANPFFMSKYGFLESTYTISRPGWIRTPEFRFPKPYHIARLEIRCLAAVGAEVRVRHSVDTGKSWSAWAAASFSDHGGTLRFFYDFVCVTQRIMFEIEAFAAQLRIEDFVLDIEVKNDQEEVMPLYYDVGGST